MWQNTGQFFRTTFVSGVFCLVFSATQAIAGEFKIRSITIETASQEIELTVEIADSRPLRNKGLMYREDLAPMTGMLFDFNQTKPVFMWMKNTPLSLDMLFIDGRGKILYIEEHTLPGSLDTITASQPVRAVLEVSAGFVQNHNVRIGDYVKDSIFDGN